MALSATAVEDGASGVASLLFPELAKSEKSKVIKKRGMSGQVS
jgi:hypothetical protein